MTSIIKTSLHNVATDDKYYIMWHVISLVFILLSPPTWPYTGSVAYKKCIDQFMN